MMICIQCALEALVAGRPPTDAEFEETAADHMRRVHPDPAVTQQRRQELERLAEACLHLLDERPDA